MKKILITLVLLGSFLLPGNSQTGNAPKLGKDPVKKVIAAMTLEEKAALVVGTGMRMPGGPPPSPDGKPSGAPPANPPSGPVVGETQSLVPGAAGTSFALPRLGITPMVVTDGPAGVRINPTRENDKNTYYCTLSLLVHYWLRRGMSSWLTQLVRQWEMRCLNMEQTSY
jgi:hypothetical protein